MARCGCSSKCNCLVIEGSNIVVTGNGSLANPYVITGLAPYTDEMARDAIGAALVAGSGISIAVNDAGDTITISNTTAAGDNDEQVRDVIGAALVAGGGISIVVDDPGDTITISSTGGYTDEMARDAIGAALVAGAGISIVVDDPGDHITVTSTATAPTLTSLGGCKSTVGAGLPPFIGRNQGDFAYDTTTGKEHVLTGAAGALVTDNFNRTDSTGLGTSSSGTAWAARGGSAANVAGNVAVGTSGGQNYVPVTAGDQTVSLSFISPLSGTADVSLVARLDSAAGTDYEGRFFYTSGTVVSLGISRGGTGALVALAATTLPYVAGHTYALTLSVIGQDVTLTATDLNTGASTSITTTDGGTVLTGPNAGFLLNAGNGSVDDFTAFNNGTLKWTYDEPIYLSCVVPGAVTVGTHVFKPGLRVPTGPTTVRRMVIRTDTAPTAGGITVVGHRYNNGVDTGDSITTSIASGANVGSTTAAVDTASGDMWKFDVTVANGGSDLLISLDCY